jgi:hypothetical protein
LIERRYFALMEPLLINPTIDTRRWAKTDNPSPPSEPPKASPPSREDEQKYSETAPEQEQRPKDED